MTMDGDTELLAPPLKPPLQNTSALRDKEPAVADIDKLLKWQEERVARRLRGEYESAVFNLAQLVRASHSVYLQFAHGNSAG